MARTKQTAYLRPRGYPLKAAPTAVSAASTLVATVMAASARQVTAGDSCYRGGGAHNAMMIELIREFKRLSINAVAIDK